MSLEEQVGRIATALERIASAMEASTSQQVVVGTDAAAQAAADAVTKAADKAAGRRRTSRGSTERETTGSPESEAAGSAASTETPSSSETGAPAQEETPPGRTLAEVQTLATALATLDRTKALAVVNKYAARIGLIPEAQLGQVYADLEALQAELKGQDAFS